VTGSTVSRTNAILPIFLMNADSVEEAEATVDAMPLVVGGLAKYQFWPVGPLAPLGLLIQDK
jgi:hypothetical protein